MEETPGKNENRIALNPELKSQRAQEFEDKLGGLIVGQERAVRRLSGLYQIYLAGMQNPGRPVGTPGGTRPCLAPRAGTRRAGRRPPRRRA